ncbi:MAG: hypothetical protein ABI039_14465 [Vicinamibacterales bacterium]
MRSIILLLVFLIGALPQWALAQAEPLLRAVAKHVPMPTFDVIDYKLQCPAGYIPSGYSATPQYPFDVNEDQYRLFVDRNGSVIDKKTVSSAAQLDGAGYSLSVYNTEHHEKNLEALATCVALSASADNTFQLVRASGAVARGSYGTVTSFCPADSPVAFGGFSDADAVAIQDYGGGPVWGTSATPIVLSSLADGTTMGPPTGWQVWVNNVFSSNTAVVAYALCGKAPTMRVYISSVSAPGAAFGIPTQFSIFAPVPEGWTAVGSGYDGGPAAHYVASDAWMDDGTVVGAMQWYPNSTTYDSGSAQVRAFMVRANGTGTGGGRASIAVLAVPQTSPPPPPTTVTVIEFYDAALDHYFITGIPDEIAKLDNGTFKGWARTGETFNAYGPGSGATSARRRPVCREYGNPLYGLDSHFYSASPDECIASMVNTAGSWILESSEVFQMDLPDANGACPAGGVAVYRIWNKRKDSNHRYTTKTAIRDQMVARGGIAEGYGPNAVALCGLP